MKVLVDTSVWSLALRREAHAHHPEAEELKNLVAAHIVEIIGPIRQELLSGVRDQEQFTRLESSLAAFPDLPLGTKDYVLAAKFFNLCRSKGIQGSNTDFLICAVAVRGDLAIFTTDLDFGQYKKCLPINLYEIKRSAEQAPARYRRSAPKREA